jgi:hypothetical protein
MSVSQESPHDDRELTRYLLGQLSEEDADRVDELAIVDDGVAWRVREVENELVDAYVRGTLDAESRQHFETHYLASPKRREKVRFAERFVRAADAAASPAEQSPEPLRGAPLRGTALSASSPRGVRGVSGAGWLDWLVPRSPAGWGFVYGVAALLVIASGLLVLRDLWLARALNESEQQRAALDRRALELEDQLVEQRAAAADAERALEEARAAARHPASRPSPSSSPGSESGGSPATTLALVLWPQTRGVSGSNPGAGAGAGTGAGAATGAGPGAAPAVAVPPDVDRVALELQLDAPDFVRYSVTLEDSVTNRIVWRSNRVTAPEAGEPPMVSIAVPANLLKSQAYALELTGYGATGSGEVIGSYAFQIVRR